MATIPSLALIPSGYKASKLYSVLPTDGSGDLDVVRATTATRVNSSGLIESVASNVPRLDYSNGSCPSILVEPQRTNLWYYSEQFDNAEWLKTECTITANSVISPDGTQNADKITDTTANNEHRFRATSGLFIIAGATTFSIYAKAAEYTKFAISNLSDGYNVIFNLSSGVVDSVGTDWSNAQITSVGNGWYRLSATISVNKTVGYGLVNASGNFVFTGTGTKGVYIWGAQAELGSYATSYIPTTSESVTRNADVISKTGISDLIGQTEGVVFMDFVYTENDTNGLIPIVLSNTAANQLYLWVQTDGRIFADFYFGGSTQASISTAIGFAQLNTRYKIAMAYKANDFAFYINGQLVGTDSSGSVSGLNRLDLDYNSLASTYGPSGQYVNSVALWKTRLTNSELATLTTL